MLPVIVTDPIKFNLTRRGSSPAFPKSRPSSSASNPPSDGSNEGRASDSVTLYPITVEFDRLLRRQQQLRQCSRTGGKPGRSTCHSGGRFSPSSASGSARSTPSKRPSLGSRSSSLYDSTDPAAFLTNLDAPELLYATIIHYYASLCSKWSSSTVTGNLPDSDKVSGKNTENGKAACQRETESLDSIYRILCTPGTRTLLLLADKNEIVDNYLQQSPHEISQQLPPGLGLEASTTSSNGHDADIEEFETSDLEHFEKSRARRPILVKSQTQRDRQEEFTANCPSSGINSSMSEDCLTASLRGEDSLRKDPNQAGISGVSGQIESGTAGDSFRNSRAYQIGKLMGINPDKASKDSKFTPSGIKMGVKDSGRRPNGTTRGNIPEEYSQTTCKKSAKKYISDFDLFLETALARQAEFRRILSQRHLQPHTSKILEDHSTSEALLESLGIEQQIVGCVTFYKSYRLTGIKVIELAFISVSPQYRASGIGTYLLRSVKESGQIGPYDAIRVKIPANSGGGSVKHFFLANEFTDDMILNASFDQLDSVCSDGEEEGPAGESNSRLLFGNYPDSGERSVSQSPSKLNHSLSFDNGSPTPSRKFTTIRNLIKSKTILNLATGAGSGGANSVISLCYLPPFSVATSLTRDALRTSDLGASLIGGSEVASRAAAADHRLFGAQSRALLVEMDNRYVDELIEEANGIWRRDLLAAYRTQWSCVGRLRAEILRLRGVVRDSEQTIDRLKRENLQLKTKLLQNETSTHLSAQKHLFLLKNFNFDSLDF